HPRSPRTTRPPASPRRDRTAAPAAPACRGRAAARRSRSFGRLRFVVGEVLQILVVQAVTELSPLGGQIRPVLLAGDDLDRYLFDDRQTEAVDARQLLRVVGEDADRRQTEVGEDLVADPVVARIGREAELDVRLDRVETLFLQFVRTQLVEEADAAALLRHVEQHPAALALDLRERML